jgi:hypothetical protein
VAAGRRSFVALPRASAPFSNPLEFVIAGLDPAIHLSAKTMDARVKPAHDDWVIR